MTVLIAAFAFALGRKGGWVLLPALALWAVGAMQAAQPVPEASGQIIRLIQPNAAQHLKWHPDHVMGFFERQEAYTAAAAERQPDLIIWPETSVPAMLANAAPAFSRIADAADGVPVVLGIQRRDEIGALNSLVVLDGQGAVAEIYDKYHLVPFGEYIPLDWLLGYTPAAARTGSHHAHQSPPTHRYWQPAPSAVPFQPPAAGPGRDADRGQTTRQTTHHW